MSGVTAASSLLDDLSDYERLRNENIRRNYEELKKLGLFVDNVTRPAPQSKEKKKSRRVRVPPGFERRSARIAALPYAPSLLELPIEKYEQNSPKKRVKRYTLYDNVDPRSIKNRNADIAQMRLNIKKKVPPLGTQIKRGVMEALSPGCRFFEDVRHSSFCKLCRRFICECLRRGL